MDAVTLEAARSGESVALARALVAIPSVNPDLEEGGAGEARAADFAQELLRDWGFQVERREPAPGRVSVLARGGRRAPGARQLLLCGHLDTVGVAGMTVDPYRPEIRGGRLYGRGSCDMKGGVAALLSAARSLHETGVRGEVAVALTADEEHASVGLLDLLEGPLAQGDTGQADAARAAVVAEPTELAVMPAHKGFQWHELRFHGRAAHGSRPDRGVDAIRQAGRFLSLLDRYEETLLSRSAHPLLGHGSVHAGTIRGGTAPSVYPEACGLVIERRTLPGEGPGEIRAEVDALVAELPAGEREARVEVRDGLVRPPGETHVEDPLVRGLGDAARSQGLEAPLAGMTAWVEAAFFLQAGIPAVTFGPGSIEEAHGPDESIPVDEIESAVRVLETFGNEYLA